MIVMFNKTLNLLKSLIPSASSDFYSYISSHLLIKIINNLTSFFITYKTSEYQLLQIKNVYNGFIYTTSIIGPEMVNIRVKFVRVSYKSNALFVFY